MVSVPSRGIVSSNYYLKMEDGKHTFPSPCGELLVLMYSPKQLREVTIVSVPLRGIVSSNPISAIRLWKRPKKRFSAQKVFDWFSAEFFPEIPLYPTARVYRRKTENKTPRNIP